MGNAQNASSSRKRGARVVIQSPLHDDDNNGTRVKFANEKRNHQTYTITPKMVVGEIHPDDVTPRVVRNRTKPPAGLEESEVEEETAKYKTISEASIKPHPVMTDEYSGIKIPPKHKILKEVDDI